jgi:hypothetical protein
MSSSWRLSSLSGALGSVRVDMLSCSAELLPHVAAADVAEDGLTASSAMDLKPPMAARLDWLSSFLLPALEAGVLRRVLLRNTFATSPMPRFTFDMIQERKQNQNMEHR